jgi:hypothetical protein
MDNINIQNRINLVFKSAGFKNEGAKIIKTSYFLPIILITDAGPW